MLDYCLKTILIVIVLMTVITVVQNDIDAENVKNKCMRLRRSIDKVNDGQSKEKEKENLMKERRERERQRQRAYTTNKDEQFEIEKKRIAQNPINQIQEKSMVTDKYSFTDSGTYDDQERQDELCLLS